MISLACQLDHSCPVAARELLHTTVILAFLEFADNAVYQICTPTVESIGPDSLRLSSSHVRLVASHSPKKCKFLSKQCVTQKYAVHPLLCLYIPVHVTVYA